MTLVIFIIILSVLVFVHELGHYLVAKKVGVRVEEFGLGMPPRLIGKKVGETLYSLNLLPFGGFVKLTGDDIDADEEYSKEALKDPRSFVSKTPLQRAAVIVAGVVMHIILAVSFFYIVLFSNGFKTSHIPLIYDYDFKFGTQEKLGTVVMAVQPDSAAEKYGIEVGEAILKIDGVTVSSVEDVRKELLGKLDQEVTLDLVDLRDPENDSYRTLNVVPQADEEGYPVLGVFLAKSVALSYNKPWQKVFSGPMHTYNVLAYSLNSFGQLISTSVQNKTISPVTQSVAGPVGIYQIVGGVVDYGGSKLLVNLMDFVALMAISLAFINILPFPALDGGRLVFIIIEGIRGKPFMPSLEAKIHKFGLIALLSLLALVTIKDIFI